MANQSPTPILLDTAILSQLVSDVLETVGAPSSKKSACLNKVAARISGPKHNWGFLTGRDTPVIADAITGFDVIEVSTLTKADDAPDLPTTPFEKRDALLSDALDCNLPVILLGGSPGDGKFHNLSRLAKLRGQDVIDLRMQAADDHYLEGEVINRQSLRAEFRAARDNKVVTVYSDIECMSNLGLKELEREIGTFMRERSTGQVVLTTNRPKELINRLRLHAPGLLNRAFSIITDDPVLPLVREHVLKAAGRDIEIDKTLPDFPSRESWDKAGKIIQAAETGRGALVEAEFIARSPEVSAPFGYPDMPKVSAQDLIEFMANEPKFSARASSFMQDHIAEVQSALDAGQISPKTWQSIARLAQLLEEAVDQGSKDRQLRHTRLLREFATVHLGRQAEAFLAAMDI